MHERMYIYIISQCFLTTQKQRITSVYIYRLRYFDVMKKSIESEKSISFIFSIQMVLVGPQIDGYGARIPFASRLTRPC